jgi:hypothetical protein
LYGSTCSVPALPGPRSYPVTFVTADARVATCGGYDGGDSYLRSCLVLAPGSGWQEGRLGSLGVGREWASVTTLPGATFILGGGSSAARTSEVLLAGEDSWREGPAIPIDMYDGCAVMISATQLLAISDGNIREFDTSVSGPLSTAGWRPPGTWPDLATARRWPGCAATGGRVVVAGGRDDGFNNLKSTEVINISTHRVTAGPELLEARYRLQLAVLPAPGGAGARVLAIGGRDGGKYLARVEEWLPGPGGTSTWRQVAPLQEARSSFGAVALPAGLVCPA